MRRRRGRGVMMSNVPEVCGSVCGALALVGLVVLPALVRMLRNAPEYVRVQDVPGPDGEWL